MQFRALLNLEYSLVRRRRIGIRNVRSVYAALLHKSPLQIRNVDCTRLNTAHRRLRLTADGQLRNCLFSSTEYDLLPILRSAGSGSDDEIDGMLRSCVHGKLPGHAINDPGFLQPARGMNAIGG
jgi:molybdenum cofactor biosynthesis enzyme MoaA